MGAAASQIIAFGLGVARGAINNGVTFSFNINPFRDTMGLNANIHY